VGEVEAAALTQAIERESHWEAVVEGLKADLQREREESQRMRRNDTPIRQLHAEMGALRDEGKELSLQLVLQQDVINDQAQKIRQLASRLAFYEPSPELTAALRGGSAEKKEKKEKKEKTKEKKEKEKKGKRIRPKIEAKAEAWGSSPSPSSSPQQQVVRSWQEEVSSCGGETEWEPGDWEVPVQLREGSLGVTMRERSGALFVWEFKPGSPAVDVLQCGDQLLSLGLGTTRIPVSTISQMKTAMAHLKDARGLRANDIVLLGMRRNS
jgi:hypothetical protein